MKITSALPPQADFAQQQLLPTATSYYDASTNRIASVAYSGYDESGRPKHEPADASRRMRWDAEGRLVELTPSGGKAAESFEYDGAGLRIRRTVGPQTTHFVYDANGELMAESPTGASVAFVAGNPRYLITDHLGSLRVVTDHQGTVLARRDYLPFGANNTRSADGYETATDVRQRFAGSERDLVRPLLAARARLVADSWVHSRCREGARSPALSVAVREAQPSAV